MHLPPKGMPASSACPQCSGQPEDRGQRPESGVVEGERLAQADRLGLGAVSEKVRGRPPTARQARCRNHSEPLHMALGSGTGRCAGTWVSGPVTGDAPQTEAGGTGVCTAGHPTGRRPGSRRPASPKRSQSLGAHPVDLQVVDAAEVELAVPGSVFWREARLR